MRTQHSASFCSVQVLIKLVTQDLPAPCPAGLGHKCSLNVVQGCSQFSFFRKSSGRYTCGRGLSLGQYIARLSTRQHQGAVCVLSFLIATYQYLISLNANLLKRKCSNLGVSENERPFSLNKDSSIFGMKGAHLRP